MCQDLSTMTPLQTVAALVTVKAICHAEPRFPLALAVRIVITTQVASAAPSSLCVPAAGATAEARSAHPPNI